jgi:hypothetical protein
MNDKKKIFTIKNLDSGLNDALNKFYYIYKIFKYLDYDYHHNNFLKCKIHYNDDSKLLENLGFNYLSDSENHIIENKLEIKELVIFITDHNRDIDLMNKTLINYDYIEINICNNHDDSILFGFSNSLIFPIKNYKNFYNDIFIKKNNIDYKNNKNNIIIHVRMNDYCYVDINEKIFSCNSQSYTNENFKTLKYYYEKINDIINDIIKNNKSIKIYIFSNLFTQELFDRIKYNNSETETKIIIDELNKYIDMYNSLEKNNVKVFFSNDEKNIIKFILLCNKSNLIYKTTGTFTNLANIYYNHLKIIDL